MNSNWKTTTLGILTFIAVLLNAIIKALNGHLSSEDIAVFSVGTATGAGLLAAKDHDK
jgi:hypothetical protein